MPISKGHGSETSIIVDEKEVYNLVSFGFEEEIARKALKETGGDILKATDWIFNNPNASVSSMDAAASNPASTPNDFNLPDGRGKYQLTGFVSHSGTSTHCGHYVAHIYKDGRWVIFNDNKVGASINPPKEMGYLYFFERLYKALNKVNISNVKRRRTFLYDVAHADVITFICYSCLGGMVNSPLFGRIFFSWFSAF